MLPISFPEALNDKTVTRDGRQQQWRSAYSLPHRVVDSSAADAEVLELEVLSAPSPDRTPRE